MLAVLGAAPSCKNNSNGVVEDEAGDGCPSSIPLDSTVPDDTSSCDPCSQVCPCTPGDTFFNAAACETVVCGPNGEWGGINCAVGDGCPDAGDDMIICDPCLQVCPCTPGDYFDNVPACETLYCPDSGEWGVFTCIGAGCQDASGDVAASESGADAISDAGSEAAQGNEASIEAGAD